MPFVHQRKFLLSGGVEEIQLLGDILRMDSVGTTASWLKTQENIQLFN
jgi:hypothetical protein